MEGETGISTPDLHEMRVWMVSQLYWDPAANATELMLDGFYYTAATPHLLEHMRLYTAAVVAATLLPLPQLLVWYS
jgi:hypothetical protein